jgi:hypothetical protein
MNNIYLFNNDNNTQKQQSSQKKKKNKKYRHSIHKHINLHKTHELYFLLFFFLLIIFSANAKTNVKYE